MRNSFAIVAVFALLSGSVWAAPNAIKPHHVEALGGDMNCRTCHTTKGKFQRPDTQACIDCHGEMSEIPTKPNRWDKKPHSSHHYEDLLECTVCHSEHKASKAICNDCHVVEFSNLK